MYLHPSARQLLQDPWRYAHASARNELQHDRLIWLGDPHVLSHVVRIGWLSNTHVT